MAGLMALLLLVTLAFAASAPLHQLVHADQSGDSPLCAVCLVAQGQVSSAETVPLVSAFVFTLLFLVAVAMAAPLVQNDCRLAPSRAPPFFS